MPRRKVSARMRVIPYYSQSCYVCQHPEKEDAERHLLKGASYKKVLDHLPSLVEHGITPRILRTHMQEHLAPSRSYVRQAIEEFASRRGVSIYDSDRSLVGDYALMAHLGIQRVVERMAVGEVEPEISDGLAFARLLLDIERGDQDLLDRAKVAHAMGIMTQIIRDIVDPAQFQSIAYKISTDPTLRDLDNAVAGHKPQAIEAETA